MFHMSRDLYESDTCCVNETERIICSICQLMVKYSLPSNTIVTERDFCSVYFPLTVIHPHSANLHTNIRFRVLVCPDRNDRSPQMILQEPKPWRYFTSLVSGGSLDICNRFGYLVDDDGRLVEKEFHTDTQIADEFFRCYLLGLGETGILQ